MQYEVFGQTDVGLVRTNNEDSFLINKNLSLFIVADGMGGYQKGEVASQITCESIADYFKNQHDKNSSIIFDNNNFKESLYLANSNIRKKINETSSIDKMGSTVVSILMQKDGIHILNVGDSRCYLVRENKLIQVSVDHSLIQETKAAGINKDLPSQFRNIITRAVGMKDHVEPDVYNINYIKNDKFLLCSDGLHGYVDDETIKNVLCNDNDIKTQTGQLIEAAKKSGGKDNITCIIINIFENSDKPDENLMGTVEFSNISDKTCLKKNSTPNKNKIIIISLLIIVAFLLLIFVRG